MRKSSIVFLGGVLAVVASLVVGPAATAKSTGASAGTVVIVHDQEPGGTLNNFISEGNGYTNALVMNLIMAGGVIYDNNVQAEAVPPRGPPEAPAEGAAEGQLQVQGERELERRQAGHRRRLHGPVPDDHEPELGHHLPRGLRGHREDPGEGQVRHRHVQAQAGLRGLGRPARNLPAAGAQGRRPGLQQALGGLGRHLERSVQVPELAEGHAAHARQERRLQGGPGGQARPAGLSLHQPALAVPGAEER